MKTLSLLPLSLKKARTFAPGDIINDAAKDVTNFVTRLVEHNKSFLQENPSKLVRTAQNELIKCESLIDRLLERAIPTNGRPYRPSGLERQVIDELERAEGQWQISEEVH